MEVGTDDGIDTSGVLPGKVVSVVAGTEDWEVTGAVDWGTPGTGEVTSAGTEVVETSGTGVVEESELQSTSVVTVVVDSSVVW